MLTLYNTMSRSKEVFEPLNDKKVKMFTCGPSIYRRPHVGNYRSFLWEDTLQRYLEYRGYAVERIINFTDVEDKAIAEAGREGINIEAMTGAIADQFFKDTRLLRIKLPDFIPRSSTSVDQAVELIEILLQKGYAYRYQNNIFFDPLKFEGFGKLFRLDMSRWPKEKKRFRRDTYPGRRWNLGDFILWHGYREGDSVYWDTEIGRGRPAWNIQDPAMITKHLGYRVDISCGGIDNIYRHHDYNIAVIEAASGEEFSKYWAHGEHLLADGRKMSKSKGNIIYPDDLVKEGFTPEHIRFYLLYGHYRKQMNLTRKALLATAGKLDEVRKSMEKLFHDSSPANEPEKSDEAVAELISSLADGFRAGMDDDLNIKSAFDSIADAVARLAALKEEGRTVLKDLKRAELELRTIDEVLQVLFS